LDGSLRATHVHLDDLQQQLKKVVSKLCQQAVWTELRRSALTRLQGRKGGRSI
jgi:hypothetical protein